MRTSFDADQFWKTVKIVPAPKNPPKYFTFSFDGKGGSVAFAGTENEQVRWGGMNFQLEAAAEELRAAIEAARDRANVGGIEK